MRILAALTTVLLGVSSLHATCTVEISNLSAEVIHCAQAQFAIDTTFDDAINYDEIRSGLALGGLSANYDGLSLFDAQFPVMDDLMTPFFAAAEFTYQGPPSAADSVTTHHSGNVHLTPGSTFYEDKDAIVGTMSHVTLSPIGVSDVHIQLSSDFRLHDDTQSGRTGGTAFAVSVNIQNQDSAVLFSHEGTAVLDLEIVNEPALFDDFDPSINPGIVEITSVDANTFDIAINLDETIPISVADQELILEVEVFGNVFTGGHSSPVPAGSLGWASSSPASTTVILASPTEGGTFSIDALIPMPDLNADGVVDIFDLAIVSENWDQSGIAGLLIGDANKDGEVDIFDVALISENWSPNSFQASSVPEPSTLAAFIYGVISLIWIRRSSCR